MNQETPEKMMWAAPEIKVISFKETKGGTEADLEEDLWGAIATMS